MKFGTAMKLRIHARPSCHRSWGKVSRWQNQPEVQQYNDHCMCQCIWSCNTTSNNYQRQNAKVLIWVQNKTIPRKGLDYWRDRRTTIFLKHCGSKRPQLLIFDGHSSHETLAIIERAIEEDIALLSLPPHCTHHLQQLDRIVFGSLKKFYNSSCAHFLSAHPLHVINKWTFPLPLRQAWDLAFT